MWKLSAADPGGARGSGGRWPLVVRVAVLIGLWGSFVGSLVITHAAGTISANLIVFAVVAGLIEHVAILAFLGQLCRRIPHLALARRARFVMWGVAAVYGAILIASAIGLIAIFGGWGRPGAIMTAVPAVIGLLAAAIFGLLYLVLAGDLAGVLREEARLSGLPVARAVRQQSSVGSSSEAAPHSRAEEPQAD